jgi:membrane-bound lytic murein transglycosylase D
MPFLNKILNLNIGYLVTIFLTVFLCLYVLLKIYVYNPPTNEVAYSNNNFYVLGLNIPPNLEFCGEKIPSNNYEIKNDLEREFKSSSRWKSNSNILFNKAQKWFPYIEPILKAQGVPDDFKYVAVIESHLSNVNSPAGAAGFWQLLPTSARHYGLEVNDNVDERYHVEKATVAACQHFKDAYKILNNWTLSAAAYNMGIGGVQQALKRQKTDTYFDLLLNPETGSFVYRILAYKTLLSSPGHFGIKKKKLKYFPPIPFRTFKIDSTIHDLITLAKNIGCTKGDIKFFNPWILKNSLHHTANKTYEIRIPKNNTADYSSYIIDLVGESGETFQDDKPRPDAIVQNEDSTSAHKKIIYHQVKEKETLAEIAEFYEVKEDELIQWNGLSGVNSVEGKTLQIIFSEKK